MPKSAIEINPERGPPGALAQDDPRKRALRGTRSPADQHTSQKPPEVFHWQRIGNWSLVSTFISVYVCMYKCMLYFNLKEIDVFILEHEE